MNIVKLQDQLKNFSQDQLVREMQAPSGNAPQFLVLGEIMRRKRMQDDFTAQNAKDDEGTVAQEAVAAAGVPQGGIADMARALAPSTDMAQNTGVQAMYAGGFVKKMAEGGGTSTAKRYTPRDERVLADAILISMANRKGMTVSEYLRAMSPKERDLVESQAANRATRDRMQALEPSIDAYSGITAVNPSYKEQLTSVFPPDPEPVRNRPNFEDFGREGAPTYQERGYAARLPSFDAMLTPNFEETGREPEPGFFTDERIRRALAPSLDELVTQNRMASMEGVNAVRPEYVSGYAPATPQLPFAMPDMGQAEGIASNMVRPGYISGNAPINMGVVPEAAGTNALQAQREELAYNVQGGRAGPQTALPTMASMLRLGPGPNRSGLNLTDQPYDMGPNSLAKIPEALSGTVNIDAEGNISVDYPEEPPAIDEAAPEKAAAQDKAADTKLAGLAAAKTAADEATAAAGTGETGGAGGGGGGGGGGAGGAGGMSSYEQELMNVLQKREKAAEQDKWLALAQVGLNLMSSTQPTLGGAIGEAGLKGVEAARGARDQYDKDRIELLGALEQSRMARASAAAKAAQGARGKDLPVGALAMYDADIEAINLALTDTINPPSPDQKLQLVAQRDALLAEKTAVRNAYRSQHGIGSAGASPAATSGVYSMEEVPS